MRSLATAAFVLVAGCAGGADVQVFAAASLGDALDEVARQIHGAGGPTIATHYAGSNTLVQQLLAGARADLVMVADRRALDPLIRAGRVQPHAIRELLVNSLVVVTPRGTVPRLATVSDLLALERLAIADPGLAPAGAYARDWLQAEGLWLELEPKVVPMLDVRAALAAVAAGHLPAGIVYASDAAAEPRVERAFVASAATAPEIHYVVAPLVGGPRAAGEALELLLGERQASIFRRHGFGIPP